MYWSRVVSPVALGDPAVESGYVRSHVLHILGCGCFLFLECQHEEGGCGYLQWDT